MFAGVAAVGMTEVTLVEMQDRKQAREELRSARLELAHMTDVMTMEELTASIVHEVNQPLAAITTNAETGLRWLARPEPDIEKVREYGHTGTGEATHHDGSTASIGALPHQLGRAVPLRAQRGVARHVLTKERHADEDRQRALDVQQQ